jgi:DNA-binding CsgD family transcriptional regulator
VFVKTILNKGQLAGRQLRNLYNLSATEVEVSELLANGQSPLQIAEERQVSINTIRTQLRQIFAKTDCSNLTDLVRLLAKLSC